jgi:CTD nuclear envelope phosphatase 1
MNSLNILSGRVSPPQTPAASRSNSYGSALSLAGATEARRIAREDVGSEKVEDVDTIEDTPAEGARQEFADEKISLLQNADTDIANTKEPSWHVIPRRIASVLIISFRWVVSTIAAPGVYLIACLYDERGQFAPLYQLCKLWPGRYRTQSSAQAVSVHTSDEARSLERCGEKDKASRRGSIRSGRRSLVSGSSSGLSSESESDRERAMDEGQDSSVAHHTRSKSMQSPDEIAPARRSIRIKLNYEDSLRQRKHRKAQSASSQGNSSGAVPTIDISPATLKSPTSPATSLSITKYPRAPTPPRPLIPRRQPSYSVANASNGKLTQKTLILDLDETLIHSMAKGGRMSTGHMVEVKLNTYIGVAGQTIGPQHPILYYVHKRPHCDDFLRRVRSLPVILSSHVTH